MVAGDRFIECSVCGTQANDADWMARHMDKHGVKDQLRTELEEQMAAFRKQVEREFAETIASLFGLVVEARENDMKVAEADNNPDTHRWARGQLNAYSEAIESVRVMADLDPETGEPA